MPTATPSRSIGRPQVEKHAITLHACTPGGLVVSRIDKRTSPEAFKALSRGTGRTPPR